MTQYMITAFSQSIQFEELNTCVQSLGNHPVEQGTVRTNAFACRNQPVRIVLISLSPSP